MSASKKIQVISSFEVYDNESQLSQEELKLLQRARKAVESAYAPYSNFFVGAAILLEDGQIVIGNNQENAAYPSGLCAERVAIYHAGAQYPGIAVKMIAVTCKAQGQVIHEPVTPCGACRQAIAEYETRYGKKIRIIMAGESGKVYATESIESLLPLMFNRRHLK
ncbi:MAG: cytidine deaminase [Bacteroidia bacterium]